MYTVEPLMKENLIKDTSNFPMHQPIQWQYIFVSERGQPLYNGRNELSQYAHYCSVPGADLACLCRKS